MAEKYDAAMKQLNATFSDSDKTSDLYLRAQKQINNTLDESTIKANQQAQAQAQAWKHLGSQIEDTMLNAAFMKESWSKAITSIMEDIAKLILKMYVLDAISKKLGQDGSGGSGGGGGFLSSLLGAFMGAIGGGGGSGGGSGLQGGEGDIGAFASGGYANAGMSYLVGEKGPELFTPGSSGTVSPNGSFGGVTHVHNYDLRGADAGAEQRLLRLFPIVEERAVNRAVNTVQERQLRR
jgi:lambda family phage tail tape measure protein